ncbi:alkaline phosphatase [Cellulomonas sp. ATA003]|uniref:alkaline phosphatase n=1 Tax=Cellulomonas sp. ATA003 TaxID=3073064 RepID=UPI002873F120|nr:alkaline phosphatase [Cellulomonas sp. ATA003]WNB85122.1 alkaline phosphatase [Cellulomonas sp. ATA003]
MYRRVLAGTAAVATLVVGATVAPASAATDGALGPKNVIVLIGDGMGFHHIASTNLYETGQSDHLVEIDPADGTVHRMPGEPVQVFETWERRAMTTFSEGGEYDPEAAWADFTWVASGATDSGAAGTAMATGSKTNNGAIGVDSDGRALENVSERAIDLGKAAGVVSSVPFSHATPAGYVAHNPDRNDYHGVAAEMVGSDMTVVMGAGHPSFDDSHQALATPAFDYIDERAFSALADGQTPFTFVEERTDFEALATADDTPERVFGLAQVGSTLQQARASEGDEPAPYTAPLNDVPTLETMTRGALNVLDADEDGFFLMVEGGAIDWTGHANDTVRNIEETQDFNASVEAAVEWVQTHSSWDETLVVVTADHETGYLGGVNSDPSFTALYGQAGQTPTVEWYSGSHTNQVVPVFAQGHGVDALFSRVRGTDPVRGDYIDNTDLANVLLADLWSVPAEAEGGVPVEAVVPTFGAPQPGQPGEPGEPSEPGEPGTEVPGALTLSVADGAVVLGDARNAGDRLRLTGDLPTVSVTDTRTDASGWSVSGQATDLVQDDAVIRAAHLGWTPGLVAPADGVTAGSACAPRCPTAPASPSRRRSPARRARGASAPPRSTRTSSSRSPSPRRRAPTPGP